jgi:uncharacterized protein YecE (DUF72 family)
MPTRSSPKAELALAAGSSGWSYGAWKGPFYPQDLPARRFLAWYAERLPTVEVNHTFRTLPEPHVVTGWAEAVPETFRFALKAPQGITHFRRLGEVAEETAAFLDVAGILGARLGALLFQLPPNFKRDLERFDAFAARLPAGTRAAFEFRHPSWNDAEVHARLRERGFAWVLADTDDAPPPEWIATASWAYLRLRRSAYTPRDLELWLARVRNAGLGEAFVFFKHEDEGAAPRLAAELLRIAGATPAGGVRVGRPSASRRSA